VNFSLFQSLPDAWGIDQLFPVLPLTGLNQPASGRAVLLDITCDSDGIIDHFIDGDGMTSTMPMPAYNPESPPFIGFFMVGAYQEILGNMHNLFGDTASLDIWIDEAGHVSFTNHYQGNTVAQMLTYVQLEPSDLLARFTDEVQASDLDHDLKEELILFFEQGLYGYTYLEDNVI
jgi:arginine decarboxylase